MSGELFEKMQKIVVNTGNLLSLHDITTKPARNATQELTEVLNVTLKNGTNVKMTKSNGDELVTINPQYDDLSGKIAEHDVTDLQIRLKIFINNDDREGIADALDRVFNVLNVYFVQTVIVSYHHKGDNADHLTKLQNIWRVLEMYVENKKIGEIGVSDVDEVIFETLYSWAAHKPNIVQINLATCCVVPVTLQEFCKVNTVQVLTHSDPLEILPDEMVQQIFGRPFTLSWALRFHVQIKCRGVLMAKGYIVSLNRSSESN